MALRAGLLLLALLVPALGAPAAAGEAPELDIPAFYPEGPTLWRDALYWAEMSANRVRRHRGGKTETVWERKDCGPTSVKRNAERGFWILCHLAHGVVLVDNQFREKAWIDRDEAGGPLPWPNDATADSAGRLYFSSSGVFGLGAPATGQVFFIGTDLRVRSIVRGLRYANGVHLDAAQKRLYVSEHLARRIHAYDLGAPGVVGMGRVFFDFDAAGIVRPPYALAGPDGLRIVDKELYVAEYGAGRLHVLSLEGALRRTIPVRVPFVTNMEYWPARRLLAVVGAFDNNSPLLEGRVISVRQ